MPHMWLSLRCDLLNTDSALLLSADLFLHLDQHTSAECMLLWRACCSVCCRALLAEPQPAFLLCCCVKSVVCGEEELKHRCLLLCTVECAACAPDSSSLHLPWLPQGCSSMSGDVIVWGIHWAPALCSTAASACVESLQSCKAVVTSQQQCHSLHRCVGYAVITDTRSVVRISSPGQAGPCMRWCLLQATLDLQ